MPTYGSSKEYTNWKHQVVQGIDQFPIYLGKHLSRFTTLSLKIVCV